MVGTLGVQRHDLALLRAVSALHHARQRNDRDAVLCPRRTEREIELAADVGVVVPGERGAALAKVVLAPECFGLNKDAERVGDGYVQPDADE